MNTDETNQDDGRMDSAGQTTKRPDRSTARSETGDSPRVILAAGTTRTATIDGLSAAGADPAVMVHTPSADAELVEYGEPVRSGIVPVSPTGCPTPAVVTRAIRELVGFEWTVVDAGLARPTGAPTLDVGAAPGEEIRDSTAVPDAAAIVEDVRAVGASLPEDRLVVGETIPGGTTTAMAALRALGERPAVSSSLPENPIERKRSVVETALAESDLEDGDCAGDPVRAIEGVGDPVQATILGLAAGAVDRGTTVTLAGGTQQLAAAALLRHAGVEAPIEVATTSFVVADESAAVEALAVDLDVELTVTDPGFDTGGHVAFDRFAAGEAKEGVAMGGALALAAANGVGMAAVRDRVRAVYDRLLDAPGQTSDEPTGDAPEVSDGP